MTLAMTRPWKHPKTGMYWLRKRVPDELRAFVGKSEEKRSLKTKDAAEAKLRLAHALSELEAKWQNLKRGPTTLTEVQAHALALPIYDQWIRRHQDNPAEQRAWNTEIGVKGVWEQPPSVFPAHLIVAYDRAPWIQEQCFQQADELLGNAGLTVDEKSRLRLARAISAAIHRASVELEHMSLGGTALLPRLSTGSPILLDHRTHRAVPLSDLLSGWAKEKKPGQKTLYDWTRVTHQLEEFLGHADAAAIKSSDLNRWKAALIEKGLGAKTIRDGRTAPIRAILQWGVDNDQLSANPAARVVLGVKQRAGDRRRGYPLCDGRGGFRTLDPGHPSPARSALPGRVSLRGTTGKTEARR